MIDTGPKLGWDEIIRRARAAGQAAVDAYTLSGGNNLAELGRAAANASQREYLALAMHELDYDAYHISDALRLGGRGNLHRALKKHGLMAMYTEGRGPRARSAPRPVVRRGDAGDVYFVQDASSHHIKIGWAVHVSSRLRELQIGNPLPLKVLATCSGGERLERELHRRFSHLRERGEWFRPGPDLLEYIASLAISAGGA